MKRYIYIIAIALATSLSAAAQKTIEILHTNDTHSCIMPLNPNLADTLVAGRGGFIRRMEMIRQERQANPDVLVFDSGDFSQGSPYYTLFKGEVETELMSAMKYDAVTIGNHEFDFGLENMARLFKMAAFPIVCSNYDLENTPLKGLVKPYIILERFGLRIGVFGLGAKPDGLIQADKCEGVVYKDPVQVSNETAALLKSEGCDVVVCLSHLGIQTDERLIADTRNIDVVLGGHSHTFMKAPKTYLNADGKEVRLMHTGKNGVRVGRLDLTLTRK